MAVKRTTSKNLIKVAKVGKVAKGKKIAVSKLAKPKSMKIAKGKKISSKNY